MVSHLDQSRRLYWEFLVMVATKGKVKRKVIIIFISFRRYVWPNGADTEQSDLGLHRLLFHLHLLEALFHGRTS